MLCECLHLVTARTRWKLDTHIGNPGRNLDGFTSKNTNALCFQWRCLRFLGYYREVEDDWVLGYLGWSINISPTLMFKTIQKIGMEIWKEGKSGKEGVCKQIIGVCQPGAPCSTENPPKLSKECNKKFQQASGLLGIFGTRHQEPFFSL